MLYFLETLVLRFTLLLYYRRFMASIFYRRCSAAKAILKKKSKVDVPRCFVNKLLLKISQNSQENTYITCIRPTFIKNQSLLGHSIQILYVEVICHQFVRATVPMVSFKISCDFCYIFHPILTQIFHFKANNYLQLH